ncbi:RIB43A-like with coiled-coils protein 2 [Turdus rufiventris]|nr:RIB43A-like with coiled-coils protein 2 [Turdus rufiventris]
MSGLGPQRELEEAAALERRRRRELMRRERIFNARTRTIGIDKDALDAQVKERKIQEAAEKAEHERFAHDMKKNDKLMCLLEERQKNETKDLNRALVEFQKNFQKPETRREFDLNDPQALKKDRPARVSDDDPRCTISGMQKFMGEDLNYDQRMKFQKEQLREWSLQQQKDCKNALADQKLADDLYDKFRVELDRKIMEEQRKEEESRRAVCTATKNFNRIQRAREQERQRDAEWDRQRLQAARAQLLWERHQQRQNQEQRRGLDVLNSVLSQEQKAKNIYLKEEEYSNIPTDEFYAQFNTTTR